MTYEFSLFDLIGIILGAAGLFIGVWDLIVDLRDYKADNGIQYKEEPNKEA